MTPTILAHATNARDDPERATMPFVVGNVAVSADQAAVVLLTIDGVWLATKGYANGLHKEGLLPLKEVMDSFVAGGGLSDWRREYWGRGHSSRALLLRTVRGRCGFRRLRDDRQPYRRHPIRMRPSYAA